MSCQYCEKPATELVTISKRRFGIRTVNGQPTKIMVRDDIKARVCLEHRNQLLEAKRLAVADREFVLKYRQDIKEQARANQMSLL